MTFMVLLVYGLQFNFRDNFGFWEYFKVVDQTPFVGYEVRQFWERNSHALFVWQNAFGINILFINFLSIMIFHNWVVIIIKGNNWVEITTNSISCWNTNKKNEIFFFFYINFYVYPKYTVECFYRLDSIYVNIGLKFVESNGILIWKYGAIRMLWLYMKYQTLRFPLPLTFTNETTDFPVRTHILVVFQCKW